MQQPADKFSIQCVLGKILHGSQTYLRRVGYRSTAQGVWASCQFIVRESGQGQGRAWVLEPNMALLTLTDRSMLSPSSENLRRHTSHVQGTCGLLRLYTDREPAICIPCGVRASSHIATHADRN